MLNNAKQEIDIKEIVLLRVLRLNIFPNSGIKNCIKDNIATIKTLKLAKLIIIV
jgi:hypothetical protein